MLNKNGRFSPRWRTFPLFYYPGVIKIIVGAHADHCGCSEIIVGAHLSIVGAQVPIKVYKLTPMLLT